MNVEPPPIFDRTAPLGIEYEHREVDRTRLARTVISTLLAISGGLAFVFLFFAAMGAVDLGDAIAATVVAIVLGLVWFVGFGYRQLTNAGRTQWKDRERRGF
jgi:hypothetical protein